MEAPGPISTPNSITENNSINENNDTQSLIGSTEFKFTFNNKPFIITIGMSSNRKFLVIQSKEEGNITYLYENKMSLEELMKFDKIFRTCDDTEDSLNSMIVIFKGENNKIKEIINNKLVISINIRQLDGTFKTKDLELFKKDQNKDVIIENLYNQVSVLKANNSNILNEINKIRNENNSLKENVNSLMNWKNEMEKEIKKLMKQINTYELKLYKINSNIITEKKHYDFIIERLKKVNPNYESIKISLNLIYRATQDGDRAEDFHFKCDKFKNTLTVVKTEKGLKFGGFTSESWEGSGDKKDKNAFCFSLDKMKIYNSVKGKSAIFASPHSGPAFENCIFEIKDKCFENGGACSDDSQNFFDNQEKQNEINDGDEQFYVNDVEVFSVSFY